VVVHPPSSGECRVEIRGHALRNAREGDKLSERVRCWFRIHTRPGRAVFAVTWCGFAMWFLVHILG
jgi:hypothetical protein